jgi:hypothetical protein
VDLDHRVPLRLAHGEQHAVAEDAGVVHDDVEAAEDVDGLADDALAALPRADVVGVGDCRATGGDDLIDHLLGRAGVATAAVPGAAEVVDDHVGAVSRQHQCVLAAEAAAGPGDDGDAPVTHPGGGKVARHMVQSIS